MSYDRTKVDEKYFNLKFFGGNKQKVLRRDNWTCQECGMTNEQHILLFGRTINVHHIDGKGRNTKKSNNEIKNLITLCLRCHRDKHLRGKTKKIDDRIDFDDYYDTFDGDEFNE